MVNIRLLYKPRCLLLAFRLPGHLSLDNQNRLETRGPPLPTLPNQGSSNEGLFYSSLYPKVNSRFSESVECVTGIRMPTFTQKWARAPSTGLFSNCRQFKQALQGARDENSVTSQSSAFLAAVFVPGALH